MRDVVGGGCVRERGRVTGREVLRVRELDDRAVVELNRPESRNAINAAMVAELHDVCAGLERTPKILILTGTGTDFAAGADIAELRERGRDEALAGINRAVFDRIAGLPMPTIAAVEGNALGGGAELTYACDRGRRGTRPTSASPDPARDSETPKPDWASWPRPAPATDWPTWSANRSPNKSSWAAGSSTPTPHCGTDWSPRSSTPVRRCRRRVRWPTGSADRRRWRCASPRRSSTPPARTRCWTTSLRQSSSRPQTRTIA